MANFLFWCGNHNELGIASLEDIMGIMGQQIRALGHKCIWDRKNENFIRESLGYNIIIEGFTPYTVQLMAEAHAQGARFIILATEEPSDRGFNQGTQPEMVRRQQIFPEAAKFADAIIHLVPGDHVTRWFSQFCPSAYTELGYAPALVRKNDLIEPEFDFGFFGSMSNRRWNILKRLAKRIGTNKAVKIVADFPDQASRDKQMREAKVIVQLRKFERMGLVSSSRCNTALCIGRPVVAEPHKLSKPWDQIVRFTSDLEDFYANCLVVRGAWKSIHAEQMDKFKAMLPPEACIGKALAEVGVLPRLDAAAA